MGTRREILKVNIKPMIFTIKTSFVRRNIQYIIVGTPWKKNVQAQRRRHRWFFRNKKL